MLQAQHDKQQYRHKFEESEYGHRANTVLHADVIHVSKRTADHDDQ